MDEAVSFSEEKTFNNKYMSNQITGKIIVALPHKSGVSQRTGNPWEIAEYIVETHEQFPKKCLFQVSGPDRIKEMDLHVGDEVNAFIDIDAHEWQGKYYNSISAYRVDKVGQQTAQQPAAQAAPPQQQQAPATPAVGSQPANTGGDDQLPF